MIGYKASLFELYFFHFIIIISNLSCEWETCCLTFIEFNCISSILIDAQFISKEFLMTLHNVRNCIDIYLMGLLILYIMISNDPINDLTFEAVHI